MANHDIPRLGRRIERHHGIDADGNVITCSIYEHRRRGHDYPMFFVVQYREVNRQMDRPTRVTTQYTGPNGRARLDADMAETRTLLAETRVRAALAGDGAEASRCVYCRARGDERTLEPMNQAGNLACRDVVACSERMAEAEPVAVDAREL